MIWRVVAPMLLRGFGLVALLVCGVVAMAVTFEQAPQGAEVLMRSLQLHIGVSVVWLGPLICGLGVCLTGLRMDSRGELRALAVSGVGWPSIWPIVMFMGAVVAGIGLCVGELWLPSVSTIEAPLWIWTDTGPLRTIDGLHVQIESGGVLSHRSVSVSLLQRATPRLAPLSALHWSGTTAEVTEICARLARLSACMGFGLLGLWMGRLARPLVTMVGIGAVLLVVEAIAWTMGAQGRLHPMMAGSVGAWLWCLPAIWLWAQPSTRIQRPV
jgi:hypothetical protein